MIDYSRAVATRPQTRLKDLADAVDRDEVVGEIIGLLREQITGYARLPEALLASQIRDIVRSNIDLCFAWFAEGREPGADQLAAFGLSAQQRAMEGMPLEDLLHAYRVGAQAAWRALRAHSEPSDADELLEAAEIVMQYMDWVSAGVAQAYLKEREYVASEGERRLRALLDALLDDAPLDEGVKATAKEIGLPLDTMYQAFALWLRTDNPLDSSRAAAGIRDQGILALTEADRIVGLAPAGREDRLRLSTAVLTITAQPYPRGDALRVALTEVRLADDLARRLNLRGEVSLRDLTLERLLAHRRGVGDELCRGTLDVLDDETLLKTLQAYVAADTDRQTAAKALHVHPNTVDYRLRRVERLTGLNLRTTRHLALLVLALRHHDLWRRDHETDDAPAGTDARASVGLQRGPCRPQPGTRNRLHASG